MVSAAGTPVVDDFDHDGARDDADVLCHRHRCCCCCCCCCGCLSSSSRRRARSTPGQLCLALIYRKFTLITPSDKTPVRPFNFFCTPKPRKREDEERVDRVRRRTTTTTSPSMMFFGCFCSSSFSFDDPYVWRRCSKGKKSSKKRQINPRRRRLR